MRLLYILLMFSISSLSSKLMTNTKSHKEDVPSPRELGRFRLPHAAFIEVYDTLGGERNMYLTSFNPSLPYFHDPVYFLPNPGDHLDSVDTWSERLITLGGSASAFWPNYPVQLPNTVLGFEGIVQTSGFLVPGKTTGKLELYDLTSGEPRGPIDIAAGQKKHWSYHWVIWKDVDNDGYIDALTARFRVPGFIEGGDPIAQLIWFKNPGSPPPKSGKSWPWQEFLLITGGPDVYFEETQFSVCNPDCTEYSAILAGELWTERIMIYYVENIPGAWSNPSMITPLVVDAAPGQPFEAHFADLNNDGRLEILASCYDKKNKTGSLWLYQQPDNALMEPWTRTPLASGFVANSYLFGNSMTPGKSRVFWPSQEYKSRRTETGTMSKPWIALSGDDDGVHYILSPKSENPDDMTYDIQVMIDTEATTAGTMAVIDLDGDGFTEIVSAGYTAGEVYVYTFKP